MPRFVATVVYRGISHYVVEADTEEAAKEKARNAYANGVPEVMLGNEWEEIEDLYFHEENQE